MKIGTVALVVYESQQSPALVESISDDREIAVLEEAIVAGEESPLDLIRSMRERQKKEEEDFGDYVEELLCQRFVRPEIQSHGVQWLRSKIRIEQYQRCEQEATQIIADYAFKLFRENPKRREFFLAGPSAKVRIKILALPKDGS